MKNNTLMIITVFVAIIAASFFIADKFDFSSQITANTIWDDEYMEGKQIVNIQTNKGLIVAEIYENKAPITAKNFLGLVNDDFYNGLTFHRYVPGFVVQGGDPDGDGTGGSKNQIKLEIVPELKHEKGVLAMARSASPNSASSQFYFTLEAAPHLDGSYAVFGKVIEGMDVMMSLRQGDKMTDVSVVN